MWKYSCKSQFLSLVLSFLAGCLLTGISYYSGLDGLPEELYNNVQEIIGVLSPAGLILMGGFAVAGIVNIVILVQFIVNILQLNTLIILLIFMMFSEYVYLLGVVMVIPMMIVTLYGWLSLRSGYTKSLRMAHISDDEEIVKIYKLHHPMDESVKEMAVRCKKTMDRITFLYIFGMIALMTVVFFVQNFIIVAVVVIVYMFILTILLRYRANLVLPISSLLYAQCNPVACASAIIYYSEKRNGKIKLKLPALMAQCMIYLDDPQLAQDILISYPRKDPSSTLIYWSLMAYVDYLLKDEDALERCKEEASKVNIRLGHAGLMLKSDELAGIENKINLMNSDFNTCKKYYLNVYNHTRMPYEQVDAAYYIALISFVQQDYPVAEMYFEKVALKGNTMYFTKKAESYLAKLRSMQNEAAE